jgi:predicted amidohydrolase
MARDRRISGVAQTDDVLDESARHRVEAMSRILRIAAAQYPVSAIPHFAAFANKLQTWVGEAVGAGAELLLFPEYFSMELAYAGGAAAQSLSGQIDFMQTQYAAFRDLVSRLAKQHAVSICAGTYPVRDADGRVRNRCLFAFPDGSLQSQDKLTMTRFENEEWMIAPGRGLQVFDIVKTRVGVAICYDSEFPAIATRLAEAGVEVLLVPSCTDTLAGYHRVRIGCQARALENQFYVVQSPTVGECADSPSVDVNIGAAGVFLPPDRELVDDGIVVLGELNRACWLYADLDLDRVDQVRRHGQVLNYADRARARLE